MALSNSPHEKHLHRGLECSRQLNEPHDYSEEAGWFEDQQVVCTRGAELEFTAVGAAVRRVVGIVGM